MRLLSLEYGEKCICRVFVGHSMRLVSFIRDEIYFIVKKESGHLNITLCLNPWHTIFHLSNFCFVLFIQSSIYFATFCQRWEASGSSNSNWTRRTYSPCGFNTMARDDLATQGARTSPTMNLLYFPWKIPVLAPGGLLVLYESTHVATFTNTV